MERPNAWKDYTAEQLDQLHYLCEGYKAYISDNKTERECCAAAVDAWPRRPATCDLAAKIAAGEALKPGDKVYAVNRGKALMLVDMGSRPARAGRQHPGRAHRLAAPGRQAEPAVRERATFALLDTHYYGGIKKYQWVTAARWPSTAWLPRRTAAWCAWPWARTRTTRCSASPTC